MGIKNIRKQLTTSQPVKVHQVMENSQKVCEKAKGELCDDSEEEEDRVWRPSNMTVNGRKIVIDTINDDDYDWNKLTKEGKESNANFHGWVDSIAGQLYSIHLKNTDEDVFN